MGAAYEPQNPFGAENTMSQQGSPAFGEDVSLGLHRYPSAQPEFPDSHAESAIDTGETGEVSLYAKATLPLAQEQRLLPASYPSADPLPAETVESPHKIPHKIGRASAFNMRQTLHQFVRAEQALTAPIRGVARIAQKQFVVRTEQRTSRFVKEKEQAREVLHFAIDLAETMFHYGADAIDVDSALVSVCSVYGLNNVEISITNQSIVVNYVSDVDRGIYSPAGGYEEDLHFSHTVVRVVRSLSENYAALEDVYSLIHQVTASAMSMADARARLQAINDRPKLYSPMWVLIFNLMIAASFTVGIGGSWRAAFVAVCTFMVIEAVGKWVARFGLPAFFRMVIKASLLTAIALYISDETSIFVRFGFEVSAPHVVGAGLIMFMPTFFLVSCVQDALHGFPLTATGKLVSTCMLFVGLIIGIATAIEVLTYAGTTGIDVQRAVFDPPPLWVSVIGMVIGSMACAGVTQARKTNLALIALVSLVGQCVYYGFSAITGFETTRVNTVLAACAVGAMSAYLAYRMHAPQIIFSVCGIMFLLPGLTFFRGFYAFSVHTSANNGFEGIISAGSTILALAGGVVLGAYIMQNMIERYGRPGSHTRTAHDR